MYNWPQHTFRAMGCQMSIWLDDDPLTAVPALRAAEQLFHEAEARLSRFLPTSELSRLNQQAGEWVELSPEMWLLLNDALGYAAETEGLFDPTQLHALLALGYDRSFDQMVDVPPAGRTPEPRMGQWQLVELDHGRRAVRLPAPVQLDLGGVAKGYTAQQVVSFLSSWGPAMVDAGGDVTTGAAPHGWPGWPVGLSLPHSNPDPTAAPTLTTIWVSEATLATSGVDYRRWQQGAGPTVHHIVDPRTGTAAQTNLLTATVLATEAGRAEAWATAALVAGRTAALNHLRAHGLSAMVVDTRHRIWLTQLWHTEQQQTLWPLGTVATHARME